MNDFSNITDHPDYQEILSKIVTGTNPKDVSQWLRVKYTEKDQKHLHLTVKSLQEFVDKHANLMDGLRQQILAIKNGDKVDRKLSASLLNNKDVKSRIVEWADSEIDVKKAISELIVLARARMEQLFDISQQNPMSTKPDYVLLKYFETLFLACEKFDKIVNNSPDQIIQHNYTVQVMDQTVAAFQEAVRRTLAQMDTEASIQFVEILSDELKKMKQLEGPTVESRKMDAQLVREIALPE